MRHKHCLTWNMARNTENGGKWEMHTVGPGNGEKIKNFGKWKKRIVGHQYMARNIQKREKWEKNTC